MFTAKLPYYNASLDRLPFCRYKVSQELHEISAETLMKIDPETGLPVKSQYQKIDGNGMPVDGEFIDNYTANDKLAALSAYIDPNINSYLEIVALPSPKLSAFSTTLTNDDIDSYYSATSAFTPDDWERPENAALADIKRELKKLVSYQNERGNGTITFNEYDDLTVNKYRNLVKENEFMIVDITRKKYVHDTNYTYSRDLFTDLSTTVGNEYIGILPVVTTAVNALFY